MTVPCLVITFPAFRTLFLTLSILIMALVGALLFQASSNLDGKGGRSALLDLLTGLFGVYVIFLACYAFYPQIARGLFAVLALVSGVASSALFRLRNK